MTAQLSIRSRRTGSPRIGWLDCRNYGEEGLLLNALTIDFEDWYQGLEIEREHWHRFEDRIESSGRRLLGVLAEADTRATFFVLGQVAERHPELVREIHNAGHEIGTHGESHQFVYRMGPDEPA